jgi:hypothetical protein
MYNVCTCIYTVWTCICNVCTWYIPNQSKHILDLTSCPNKFLSPTLWTTCPSKVVGLRIQDCSSCPALAANQTGLLPATWVQRVGDPQWIQPTVAALLCIYMYILCIYMGRPNGAETAHQQANGACWGDQVVWALPNSMPACGSSRLHGGQSSTDPLSQSHLSIYYFMPWP